MTFAELTALFNRATPEVQQSLSSNRFPVEIRNEKGDGPLELLLYGQVGDQEAGLDPKTIVSLLSENPTRDVSVRINSPGGLAWDGLTIFNALDAHKGGVTTRIEGIAASAAAVVGMAGDPTSIMSNATLMLHRSHGATIGNKRAMEEMRDLLEQLDLQLAEVFAIKSSQPIETILALMDGPEKSDGSYLTGKQALDVGLVDNIISAGGRNSKQENSGREEANMSKQQKTTSETLGLEADKPTVVRMPDGRMITVTEADAPLNEIPMCASGSGGPVDAVHVAFGSEPSAQARVAAIDAGCQAWFKASCGLPTSKVELDALASLGYSPGASEISFTLPSHPAACGDDLASIRGVVDLGSIQNAQTVGSPTGGGYTVAQSFVKSLEVALLAYSGMLRSATVLRTSTGSPLPYPTTDDTSNEGVLLQETVAATEQDVSFGAVTLSSYTYSSKIVRVQNQLIRDSAVDIGGLVGRLLGERLGRILNRHCTTGDASSKPKGITVGLTAGVTAASASAIAADEILELIHSVDPAYRELGASFMMHDNVFKSVSLLKDGDGNYLLTPGLREGSAPTLRGWPLVINNSMASALAASAIAMLFGDLGKYIIRQVGTIRVQRLIERYAEYNQVAFIAFVSFDGVLIDAGTNPVKSYVMAAA